MSTLPTGTAATGVLASSRPASSVRFRIVEGTPKKMNEKRPTPCAVCDLCFQPSTILQEIGFHCFRPLDYGRRCKGIFRSAFNYEDDWMECDLCHVTGYKEQTTASGPCSRCRGYGWIFIRDMPWLRNATR